MIREWWSTVPQTTHPQPSMVEGRRNECGRLGIIGSLDMTKRSDVDCVDDIGERVVTELVKMENYSQGDLDDHSTWRSITWWAVGSVDDLIKAYLGL